MKTIDIYVNNSEGDELHYKCRVAESEDDKRKGLQNVDSIEKDEGMLFVYDKPQKLSFWMKDTKIPLTVCFISKDLEVLSVFDAVPFDETPMIENDAMYVLEVSGGEDIDEGDDITIGESIEDLDKYGIGEMNVIDENGDVQMKLEGGERIVSRHETSVLIRKAKLAKRWKGRNKAKYTRYCKDLGRYIFSVFERQDNRPVETVEVGN